MFSGNHSEPTMNKLIHEPDFEPAVPTHLSPEEDEPVEHWDEEQEREEVARLRTKRVKVLRLRRNELHNL